MVVGRYSRSCLTALLSLSTSTLAFSPRANFSNTANQNMSPHNFSKGPFMESGAKQDPYLPTMIVFDLGEWSSVVYAFAQIKKYCLHI